MTHPHHSLSRGESCQLQSQLLNHHLSRQESAQDTAVVKDDTLYVQAGGGVVHDSTPQYEYDETVNKAAALFRAAEIAVEDAKMRKNRG